MRINLLILLIMVLLNLSACDNKINQPDKQKIINVIDESNLNDIMLTVADSNEAVNFFRNALLKAPERIDLHRGLAKSLARANRLAEAAIVYQDLVKKTNATYEDRLELVTVYIRQSQWQLAMKNLNMIPPTIATFQRYKLEAVVADSQKKWRKADSFYEIALDLTTQPANILNNWGYSKMSRGQFKQAETLFLEAITYNSNLFTAKNNLILARASRGIYSLPLIPMKETERAELTYTAGLSALKHGKIAKARGLFEEAINLHPSHFSAAVNSLNALNSTE